MLESFENEHLVSLKPECLSCGVTLREACMVILREEFGSERHLPLLLERSDYELLRRVLEDHDFSSVELLYKLSDLYGIALMGVVLRRGSRGHVNAELRLFQFQNDYTPVEHSMYVSVAIGIAAALLMEGFIYMRIEDFEALYAEQPKNGQFAVPVSAMPNDLLREALAQAVEEERFELASRLRDELVARGEEKNRKEENISE